MVGILQLSPDVFSIVAKHVSVSEQGGLRFAPGRQPDSFAHLELASPLLRDFVRQTRPVLILDTTNLAKHSVEQKEWMNLGWGGSLALVLQRYPATKQVWIVLRGKGSGYRFDSINTAFESFVTVYDRPDEPAFVSDLLKGSSSQIGGLRCHTFWVKKGARLAEIGARGALKSAAASALTGKVLSQYFTNKSHYFRIELRTPGGTVFEFDGCAPDGRFDDVSMMEMYADELGSEPYEMDDFFSDEGFQKFYQDAKEQETSAFEALVKHDPHKCLSEVLQSQYGEYTTMQTVQISHRGTDFDSNLCYLGNAAKARPAKKKKKEFTTAAV